MHLSVRDVTRLFDVSDATITRWIKQRGFPAQRVGGQYRFNRAELLEWATAQQVKVSVELFDSPGEAAPSLADALERGGIFGHLKSSTKEEALRALVEVMPLPDGTNRQHLLQLFLAREALASTAVGDGIALPHVRGPLILHVPQPLIALGFLEQPVEFAALDGKPVHTLFSLISPTVPAHLQLLSRLSFCLHDAQLKEALRRQGPRYAILAEVRRVEAGLRSPTAGAAKGPS